MGNRGGHCITSFAHRNGVLQYQLAAIINLFIIHADRVTPTANLVATPRPLIPKAPIRQAEDGCQGPVKLRKHSPDKCFRLDPPGIRG